MTSLAWLEEVGGSGGKCATLVVADAGGHLRRWRALPSRSEMMALAGTIVLQSRDEVVAAQEATPAFASTLVPIQMRALHAKAGYIAVSTAGASGHPSSALMMGDASVSSIRVPAEYSRSVLVLDVGITGGGRLVSIIAGHPTDVVPCLLATPDGALLTRSLMYRSCIPKTNYSSILPGIGPARLPFICA